MVAAIGGGCELDLGKAVAAIVPAEAGAGHYALCANPLPDRPLPKICVPTTAGTGRRRPGPRSWTTVMAPSCGCGADELKADEVLLDPELSRALPAMLTAGTGIDALVHAIEACTNRNASPANDLYCHAAIRLVGASLRRAVGVAMLETLD